jgi:hypothetical protein
MAMLSVKKYANKTCGSTRSGLMGLSTVNHKTQTMIIIVIL